HSQLCLHSFPTRRSSDLEDEVMFLAAVHIYELRVPFHLGAHMELPQINPELKEVMGKIRDDEKFHLSWVRKYLDKQDPQQVLERSEEHTSELQSLAYLVC